MRLLARASSALAVAALLLAACKEKVQVVTPAAPPKPAATQGFTFTIRDLALATAVDASAARLTLAGSEIEAALLARDPAERAKAAGHVPTLDADRAEVEQAVARVTNGLDQPGAARVQAAAKEYAARLAAAAQAPSAPLTPELAAARASFGEALAGYRESRAAWRFSGSPPLGPEREFVEARRDMERAETGFMSRTRVAPREEGHEFDAASARMAGQMAVQKARAAAALLTPALQPHALRYTAAQEKVLEAVNAIQTARENEKPALARAYHAAKAEALAALADYFAVVSAR
jgi:hypothetical protein